MAGIRGEGNDRERGQVDGLIWQDVKRVCVYAKTEDTIAGLRDAAMIRLMSDCLLRISEVVTVNVGDLKEKTLTLRSSKQIRKAPVKASTSVTGHGACWNSIVNAPTSPAVHCSDISVAVTTSSQMGSPHTLHTVSSRNDVNAGAEGFISAHSLRVGSAVSLAQAGATVVDMRVAGRWKSSQMPAHYAKAKLAERGAIARFKEGKSIAV